LAPLISIIVPAHNTAPYIGACLDSILAQRGPFQLEVVVVDDGSDDDSAAIAAAKAGVRVLHQRNAGPSAARNRGVESARGDYISFLDSDDLWPPGSLRHRVEVLEKHSKIDLVFGDCAVFDHTGSRIASFFAEAKLDDAFWGDALLVRDPYPKLFRLNYIPTGAVLMRPACLRSAGGFNENRRLVEDLDLWLRLARNCRFAHIPAICQLKRERGDGLSADREAMALANLDVLSWHWSRHKRELLSKAVRFRPYAAYEYCLLGDHCRRRGRIDQARRWYLRALITWPSPRALYHWLRSLAPIRKPAAGQ
jgi:glycosyltransferase involved in cell wall biosynthesis